MIGTAVAYDAIPMLFDELDELLVRLKSAPFKLGFPVLKELSGPCGVIVIPQLPEGFF